MRHSLTCSAPRPFTFACTPLPPGSYLTMTQFLLVHEAVLSGLIASFAMDTTHNPPPFWSMSAKLLRVLGGAALSNPFVLGEDEDEDDVEALHLGMRGNANGYDATPRQGTNLRQAKGQRVAPGECYSVRSECSVSYPPSSIATENAPQYVEPYPQHRSSASQSARASDVAAGTAATRARSRRRAAVASGNSSAC